jgi:predicted O-methyltransferase YrrM
MPAQLSSFGDVAHRLLTTRLGRRALEASLTRDPDYALGVLGWVLSRDATLARAELPSELRSFDDLAFLFSSTRANNGIAGLSFVEGALLYRLARDVGGTIVETGRYKGGSTLILAAGLTHGRIYSIDPHVKFDVMNARWQLSPTDDPDEPLRSALRRYGLEDSVELIVEDSRIAALPPEPYDVVFIDGDHSYEGARSDFDRFATRLRAGGHVLLHDAFFHGGGQACEGVTRLVAELDASPEFERQPDTGSIAHFTRSEE